MIGRALQEDGRDQLFAVYRNPVAGKGPAAPLARQLVRDEQEAFATFQSMDRRKGLRY